MTHQCQERSIDRLMLSETNAKWTTSNIERIKNEFKTLDRNAEITPADSKDH